MSKKTNYKPLDSIADYLLDNHAAEYLAWRAFAPEELQEAIKRHGTHAIKWLSKLELDEKDPANGPGNRYHAKASRTISHEGERTRSVPAVSDPDVAQASSPSCRSGATQVSGATQSTRRS